MKTKKNKLFEITMIATKHFYVEAASQEEALEMEVVDDEAWFRFGKAEWEHDETRANECFGERAKFINPKRILHDPK